MPPRAAPTTLAEWPWVVVRVECVPCERRGCYRLARLAAKYGPEQSIAGLLRHLASDCPRPNDAAWSGTPRCAARFPDLERTFPPTDDAAKPVLYRQRQPDREDIPKPHVPGRLTAAPTRNTAAMLSGWAGDEVGWHCQRCPRGASIAKATLLDRYGDVALTLLLRELTAACPRRGSTQVYELCGACFVMPVR